MKLKILLTIMLAILLSNYTIAQEKSKKKLVVSGTILNSNGQPADNVLIFIDGKNSNVKSNNNGEFRIKIKSDVNKIAFFSFNDGGIELYFTGQTNIEIVLEKDFMMETVILSDEGDRIETGYATYYKNEITGTISSIKKSRLENNTYRSIYEMIAGEVAGVTVVGNSIRIRGLTSFRMSNEPLFVVNGAPISSINHISPLSVESITILKGPQSAMYGSRGAAGVVVIKLKGSGR
jgi:TonB-dependent SusC/RagA subfamily outer membrane receptor